MVLAVPATWRTPIGPARLYLAGKVTSQAGQNALFAALVIAAGTGHQPGVGLSAFFVAMLVPGVLLGPAGGALVDRLGAGRAYTIGAILRAAAPLVGLPFLGTEIWPWVAAATYSAASQLFTPAELSLLREVRNGNAGRTYSSVTVAQYAGQGLGVAVIAPVAYFLGGYPALILAAAAMCLLTAIVGQSLRGLGVGQRVGNTERRRTLDFRPAGRFLFSDHRASYAVIALILLAVLARTLIVAMPAYWRDEVAINQGLIVILLAPVVLGVVVGLLWAYRGLDVSGSVTATRLGIAGLIVACLSFAVVDIGMTFAAQRSGMGPVQSADAAINTTLVVIIPALFLVGLCAALIGVSARMVLAELAPAGQQGRVHALQLSLTEAVIVAPVLLAGVLTASVGSRLTLAIAGAIALAIVALMERRHLRWRPAQMQVASSDAESA